MNFTPIPDWTLPTTPNAMSLFEVAALAGLEGKWVRISADQQRAIMGGNVFGKQKIMIDDEGVTVSRSTGFGMDRHTNTYQLHQVRKALEAGKKLIPGS